MLGRTVCVYTDHEKLAYMYNLYGHNIGMSRQTANKLMSWALELSDFLYVIKLVPG